jgi:cell division protein FtsN
MGSRAGRAGRERGFWATGVRRIVAGVGLFAVGTSIGIVLGSVLEGPRLFVRRLTEPSQKVEIPASSIRLEAERLTAFRELQRERPSAPRVPATRQPPPMPPEVATAPPRPAPERRADPEAAERVISQIEARRAVKVKSASQKVVQVAAYADKRAAEALVRRLKASGFDSYISHTRPEGQQRYRVRVRSKTGEAAKTLAARLEAEGLSVWITTE